MFTMQTYNELKLLCIINLICSYYKALNGLAPDYLAQMFTERSRITYYTLRDTGDKLALPEARTSFSYRGAVLWNSPQKRCGRLIP